MERKKLISQIQQLDEQLAVEFSLLKLDARERRAAMRRVSPLWWVAGSAVAGLVIGKLAAGHGGPMALARQGMNMFRFASLVMPGMAIAASPALEDTP
ncbi:hypothetical protein [Halopseudomonas bauzanensis]|uniref:hypothetical protein n=1 Tax=Halopseudomonas bauzanensis TaxID=653930 RepID=UPI0025563465|nr:hypothetical protein [Halopseudomonas bauzanensis]